MPPGGEGAPFGKGSPFSPWNPLFPPKTFSPVRPDGPRRCLKARASGIPTSRTTAGAASHLSASKKGRHAWRPFLLALFRYTKNCRSVSPCPLPLIPKTAAYHSRPACRPFFRATRGRAHEDNPPWLGEPSLIQTKVFGRDGGSLRREGATFFQKGPPFPLKKTTTA